MPRIAYFAAAYCGARARAAHDHGRADLDDVAVALLQHPLAELVRHEQRALDVDVDDRVERLLGELVPVHLLARDVADVVDEHVERAERRPDLVGHALDLVPRADVGLHEDAVAAGLADALERRLGARLRRAVVHGDLGALLRGAHGDLGAEAGAGAGDEHGLAREAGEDLRRSAFVIVRPSSAGTVSDQRASAVDVHHVAGDEAGVT